jgi:aerobic carbon-monoxide dehydrogenase medium subunit
MKDARSPATAPITSRQLEARIGQSQKEKLTMLYRALPEFEYLEPASIKEAAEILATTDKPAAAMAGGISLLDSMKRGMKNPPEVIVSLQKIPELKTIEGDRTIGLRIGATVSIREAEKSEIVKDNYPLLSEAIDNIHSVQVKTMGTLVGNVCVGTPASDILTALIALDGQLRVAGSNGGQLHPTESLCEGPKRTKLQQKDLVTEIVIPPMPEGWYGAYFNLTRTLPDISKITCAVNLKLNGGVCESARVVLGAVAPTIIRSARAEAALVGKKLNAETINAAAEAAHADEAVRPISDMRSTAEYRKEQVRVLVRRALETTLNRANGVN